MGPGYSKSSSRLDFGSQNSSNDSTNCAILTMPYVTSWYHLDSSGCIDVVLSLTLHSNSHLFFGRIPLIPNIRVTQDQYMFSYVFYVLPQNCCAPKKRICDPKSPKTTSLPDLKVSMGAGSVPGIGSPRSSNGAPSSREPS